VRLRDAANAFNLPRGCIAVGADMAVGFVLISAAPSKEHEVYNHLLKVPEIVELHPLFGEYDLIAKIEGSDFDTLGSIIVNKIRTIDGVMDTKTLTGTRF
jgi:DNA-binding Lrp family transcriptional regulator